MYSNNKNNSKLGKGLSSLLGERRASLNSILNNTDNTEIVVEINLGAIVPNQYQPRKVFQDTDLKELARSIDKHGVLQPILVREGKEQGVYEIIAGERRFRASKLAGLEKIPAIVKELSNKDALTIAIIENIQRSNLSAIEEARGYKRLMTEFGYTQQQVADFVGKSRSYVANLMRLLSLPERVRELINNKQLEMGHARALINTKNACELAKIAVTNNLSVREVEDLVRKCSAVESAEEIQKLLTEASCPTQKNVTKEKYENLRQVEQEYLQNIEQLLNQSFNLKSKVVYNARKQKGKIVINYDNIADLKQIVDKLINIS
jgi:ParB family chromosome partitioning protein